MTLISSSRFSVDKPRKTGHIHTILLNRSAACDSVDTQTSPPAYWCRDTACVRKREGPLHTPDEKRPAEERLEISPSISSREAAGFLHAPLAALYE